MLSKICDRISGRWEIVWEYFHSILPLLRRIFDRTCVKKADMALFLMDAL